MGDSSDPRSHQLPGAPGQQQHQHQHHQKHENLPPQMQFEHFSQTQSQSPQSFGQYGHQAFDMGSLAGALPPHASMAQRPPYSQADPSQMMGSPGAYQMPQQQAFQPPRASPYMAPPQQFLLPQYNPAQAQMQNLARQQPFPMQTQIPYSPVDPYGYGMSPATYSSIDPRFAAQHQFHMTGGMPSDMAHYAARRTSTDNSPVPNFPRGPPRKPKQSGHALWVGNLPPAATVMDLKDHFSRDATSDIESVFLIAKSNCAFVNYRTEAACAAAMNRFHDSRFHGVRLVCRLRRGTGTTPAVPEERADGPSTQAPTPSLVPLPAPAEHASEDERGPTIARTPSDQSTKLVDGVDGVDGVQPQHDPNVRVPEKYFIVKSLTAQDLESSLRTGHWATQSHNEETLNTAYEGADSVYLIFSANKSGEYFGYARMASTISGEPVSLSMLASPDEYENTTETTGSPQSIHTPATATAPEGRIIDDSARGTIFWEAEPPLPPTLPDGDDAPPQQVSATSGGGQNWGRQFSIEWLSTTRLPFYRTRGLRNPWNANREVKIARDGTELEPSVGRRLVGMFHRPAGPGPGAGPPGGAMGGMGYR